MRFTDRHWHAPLWGLALLCVGPLSACDDELDKIDQEEEEEGSSAGGGSWSRHQSSKKETVADCKDECDDVCGACKADCDEDDEDCNQRCDDKRYECRRACEKKTPCSSCDSCGDTCEHDECDHSCHDSCPMSCDAGVPDAGPPDAGADAGGGSDEDVPVSIQFEARVGKKPFACGEEYTGVGSSNTTVTPTDLRMFVSDLKLITASGKEVAVELSARKPWQGKGVALLDFEDGSGDCGEGNAETNTKVTGKVPKGSYVGISFTNSVPELLNHGDPAKAVDPLSEFASLSWSWLGGFRFTKVEVREVTESDTFGSAVAHIGSTACSGNPKSGTAKCSKPNRNLVLLEDFDPKSSVIVFDVAEVFAETDVTQMAQCHSTGEYCAPMFEAFGVDFETGKALSKQTVFSVE